MKRWIVIGGWVTACSDPRPTDRATTATPPTVSTPSASSTTTAPSSTKANEPASPTTPSTTSDAPTDATVPTAPTSFPVVDCAKLLSLDDIAKQCKVKAASLRLEVGPNETGTRPSDDSNSSTRDLCHRTVTLRGSETMFHFAVYGYPTAAAADQMRAVHNRPQPLEVRETNVYLRREYRAYAKRFQYNLFVTDQKAGDRVTRFCSDEQLQTLWQTFETRLLQSD